MSVIRERKKKKQKYPRNRSEKVLHRRRLKRNIFKKRGWKLQYPDLFEEILEYPFIIKKVRKD